MASKSPKVPRFYFIFFLLWYIKKKLYNFYMILIFDTPLSSTGAAKQIFINYMWWYCRWCGNTYSGGIKVYSMTMCMCAWKTSFTFCLLLAGCSAATEQRSSREKKTWDSGTFSHYFFSSRKRFAMYISHNDRSCGINTKSEIVEICNGRQYCQENFSMDSKRHCSLEVPYTFEKKKISC